MQVKITKEAKKWLTVAEMPIVQRIITDFKDSESTAAEYAQGAADAIMYANFGYRTSYRTKVFEATAQISKNQRLHNYYSDDSGDLDVWIEFVVFDEMYGTISGGAYLSDIWSIPAEHNSAEHKKVVDKMFYQIYTLTKSSS